MQNTNALRWGILGTARINQKVVPCLAQTKRSRGVALASRDLARAQEAARALALPLAFGSYDELLASSEIDAVYVSLPNHLHFEWCRAALRAGKHVLCEKPLVLSAAHLDELAREAQAAGRILVEGFMWRHHRQTRALETTLREKRWGPLRSMHGSFHFTLDESAQSHGRPNIRLDPAAGGGALWDLGCYLTNAAVAFNGADRNPPVEAMARQTLGASGVDIAFDGLLKFADGATASFDCSFRGPRVDRLRVICADAWFEVPHPFKPTEHEVVSVNKANGKADEIATVDGKSAYLRQIEDFEAAALDGAAPLVTSAESRLTTRALEALLESARTGRAVAVV